MRLAGHDSDVDCAVAQSSGKTCTRSLYHSEFELRKSPRIIHQRRAQIAGRQVACLLFIMLQFHKKMHRTCSTPKKKLTRNVQGSERELRIERFMTAGFATRPPGEVGGVNRNRLLVDKMIVWCTILGLIMASSQRQSHNLTAVFQMPTQRARDQRKQTPAMRAPTPRIPRLDVDGRRYESAADLPRVTRGAVFTAPTKERFGPVRFELFFGSFSLQ